MRNSHTLSCICIAAVVLSETAAGQTQVDLKSQSKTADFSNATSTKPFQTGATLPSSCSLGQMYFLTTAPSGQNSYGCTATNTWSSQYAGGQTTTIKNSGTLVGASPTLDISAGIGGLVATSDNGQEISVQMSIDTSIIQSRADHQAGRALFCGSSSSGAPGTAYLCPMTPTLTTYTTGMILNWKPDLNGRGGVTTLNVDSLGAISIVKADGATAPGSSDIVAGELYPLWYDGAVFRLLLTGGTGGGATGPAGPTGPVGPAGVLASNAEYTTSKVMDSTYCQSWLGTFTGSAALTFTLSAPVAGCSIGIQNNTSQPMTINVTTNSVTLNGQNSNGTISACATPANGCKVVVIKANGTTSWDMSAPGVDGAQGAQGPQGPAGSGGGGFADFVSGASSVSADSGNYVTVYSYSAPALASGSCYSIQFEVHATGGSPTLEVLADTTVIATPWAGMGSSNYYYWTLEYCNNSGVQNAQTLIYAGPTFYGTSSNNLQNLFQVGYGGPDSVVNSPAALNWASGHTITIQMNPASGNAQGVFALIHAH